MVVKSAASVETTEQGQSTAAASRSTEPQGPLPMADRIQIYTVHTKSPVVSDSRRSTLDSAFKHSNTPTLQHSRLTPRRKKKTTTGKQETGHLPKAPHHPPEPHRRRASVASAILLLLSVFFFLAAAAAAAAPRCRGWVHSGLRSAVPPLAPCIAKVLSCVLQHGRYSTVTMGPCPMGSGGTWSRCALHSDISINFKAALPTHHCMSGIAKACSALLCCDIYSTCTPRYTHSRRALPPKRVQRASERSCLRCPRTSTLDSLDSAERAMTADTNQRLYCY